MRLSEVHAELRRLTAFWGAEVDAADHADHHLKERLEAEWKNLSRRLDESIESLRSEAIDVKALDTDWSTSTRSRTASWCSCAGVGTSRASDSSIRSRAGSAVGAR